MASIPASKKTCLIAIEKRVAGEDEAGQPLDKWELVIQVWAWQKNLSGKAGFNGNVMTAINANSWRIDFIEGLDIGMRVVHQGKPFDITRIVSDYAHRVYVDLICDENASYA